MIVVDSSALCVVFFNEPEKATSAKDVFILGGFPA